MTTRVPRISGRECVQALTNVGFYVRRQRSSHIVMRRDDPFAQLVVPDHRELDTGTLRSIIKQAGLGVAEFVQLL